jgi:hypothetical protein
MLGIAAVPAGLAVVVNREVCGATRTHLTLELSVVAIALPLRGVLVLRH